MLSVLSVSRAGGAAGRLSGAGAGDPGGDGPFDGIAVDHHLFAVVYDGERFAGPQLVGGGPGHDGHPQRPTAVDEVHHEPGQVVGEARGEAQPSVAGAQAREAPDQARPTAGQRGEVQAAGTVVVAVLEVEQRRLGEVVVGQLDVAHLGGDHRLDGSRQGRVPDRVLLVVLEVAQLLVVGERVAPQVHRQHEVGLLDHLLAVEVEVREGLEQGVVGGGHGVEVPRLVVGEALGLGVHAQALVPGDVHLVRGLVPRLHLDVGHGERSGTAGVAPDGAGRAAEVPLGHEVRVDVVVGDGAVLVGAGHAVDAEGAGGVVVTEVGPQPSRLDQELHAVGLHELVVPGGVVVAQDRVGDRGVDVEGGRARGPVAGALVAGDGPPRERRPGEAEVRSPVPRRRQGRVAPVEGVGGGPGDGQDEDRQDEDLGVPERMAVVARAREPLGGDGPALGPRAGLEEVEHAEAHRVLDLGVAVDLHVGPVPELVEVLPLIGLQADPSGVAGPRDGGGDLVAQGLAGSPRRPAIAEVLDEAQALTRGEHGGDREAGDVR